MTTGLGEPRDGVQVTTQPSSAELTVTLAQLSLCPAELSEPEPSEPTRRQEAGAEAARVQSLPAQATLWLSRVQSRVAMLIAQARPWLSRVGLSRAPVQRVAAALVVLLLLIGGAVVATISAFVTAQATNGTVSSAPLIRVGLATASTAHPQVYSVTGVAPGNSVDRLVNLQNDGTASVPLIKHQVTTSSATALDTDAALGLTVALDRCSVMWSQAAAGAAASCGGTQAAVAAASPLATLNGAAASTLPGPLSAASTGGIDHLRVRLALPVGAPGGYSALTSTPTLKIYGVADVPGAPTSPGLVAGDSQLTASWTAPASTGGAAITSYTATASPGGASCSAVASPCTIIGLTNGVRYSVTITATNSGGTGPASTAVSAVPFPAILAGAGPVLWLDGGDSTTLFQDSGATTPMTAAGQNVVLWKDKSGSGNDVTAPGAGSAPVADTSTFGQTSLTFSAGRYLARISGFPVASDYTLLVAYRPTSSCTGNLLSGGVAGAGGHAFYTFNSGGLRLWHSADAALAVGAGAGTNTSYIGTGTYVQSGGATTVDVNGAMAATATGASATSDAGIQVGALGGSFGFCGQIGEAIIYNRVLSAADRRTMEEYLGAKWSVTLAPSAPSSPAVVAGNQQATVNWTAPSSTGGSAITGYTVTASPGGATCTTSGTSCTVTGLTNGTSYAFIVAAANAAGTGPSSAATASTALTGPGAPTGVTITRGDDQLAVAWTAPAYTGTSAITGYTVTTSPGGATCSAAASPCTVTGLSNGTEYTVTVAATNGAGAGNASAGVLAIPYPTPVMAAGTIVRWFDASDGTSLRDGSGVVTTTAGTSIGTWVDLSSAGINASQSTDARRFTVSTLNGRTAALSSQTGSGTYMPGASGTFGTVIAVANPSRVTNWGTIFASPDGTDTSLRTILGTIPNGKNGIPPSNVNDWSKGTLTQQWMNSAASGVPTAGGGASLFAANPPSLVTGTFSLSTTFSNAGLNRALDGPIGEVLVFNRNLTRAEQRRVEEYLGRKWSVLIAPDKPATAGASAASSTSAAVTWTAPAYNGGAAVTGYTVTSSPGNKTCTSAGTTCTVTGLTTGVSYTFDVTATNSVGIGPAITTTAVVP